MPNHGVKTPAHAVAEPTPAVEAVLWALWRLTWPVAPLLAAAGVVCRDVARHPDRRAMVAVALCIVLATALTLATK